MGNRAVLPNFSASRVNVIALGILTGLAGMEHGFFEILQGSVAPSGVVIEAIGPAHRFWELGTEIALTIVPNFLVTGILAMTIGLAIIIWSSAFVQKRVWCSCFSDSYYGAIIVRGRLCANRQCGSGNHYCHQD